MAEVAHAAARIEAGKSRVALVLAASAILTAAIVTRAELLSSDANDHWQAAGKLEIKRQAALLEDVGHVYGAEAPQAIRTSQTRIRAAALAAEAAQLGTSGELGRALAGEALVEQQLAKATGTGTPLAEDPAYRRGDGFDVAKRLADVRRDRPVVLESLPEEELRAGNELSRTSTLLMLGTLPAAAAFLAGALAQGFPARRRLLLLTAVGLLAAAAVYAGCVEAIR